MVWVSDAIDKSFYFIDCEIVIAYAKSVKIASCPIITRFIDI